ncbi:hypothetical protein E2C01_007917 [Portunus trituberculatus]|uniref:Uncharacterized protein n=1 Tax=Portunus trituberculatus TaxID=210409 RepID=A0A5B7D1E0_PORTR|nr:hypothetical protein [Portunus trituberculatus]
MFGKLLAVQLLQLIPPELLVHQAQLCNKHHIRGRMSYRCLSNNAPRSGHERRMIDDKKVQNGRQVQHNLAQIFVRSVWLIIPGGDLQVALGEIRRLQVWVHHGLVPLRVAGQREVTRPPLVLHAEGRRFLSSVFQSGNS